MPGGKGDLKVAPTASVEGSQFRLGLRIQSERSFYEVTLEFSM